MNTDSPCADRKVIVALDFDDRRAAGPPRSSSSASATRAASTRSDWSC
ncbi:hypothetical protein WKI68_26725 [Streptomyces sp. MS1.HAVA.3]|uniref:Uncharacterized protein n=1 Tax=Streptomyces caledonius TaxID=3134107 RepID=A0ABU8U7Z9_9ACTN